MFRGVTEGTLDPFKFLVCPLLGLLVYFGVLLVGPQSEIRIPEA